MGRNISESTKKQIAGKQSFKCANKPGSNLRGLEGYNCIMWQYRDGCFDEATYHIDHIVEHSLTQNNEISNLQALCLNCHTVKTKDI